MSDIKDARRMVPGARGRLSSTDRRELERREAMTVGDLIADAVKSGRISARTADLLNDAKGQTVRALLLEELPEGQHDPAQVAAVRAALQPRIEAHLTAKGKRLEDCRPEDYLDAIDAVARGEA